MEKIIKTREIKMVNNTITKTVFVCELANGESVYAIKGGHIALGTANKLRSGRSLKNVKDWGLFTYYGHAEECATIDTMETFLWLCRDYYEIDLPKPKYFYIKVLQEYTKGYGWNDRVSYDANDKEEMKYLRSDLKSYREEGVRVRVVDRRIPYGDGSLEARNDWKRV